MESNTESEPKKSGAASSQNYYDLLGISPQATDEEIKRAYRKAALRLRQCLFLIESQVITDFHLTDPDKNPDPEAAAQFQAVDKAYKVLSDPRLRSTYDQLGPRGMKINVFLK